MTITLTPTIEKRLTEEAQRQGMTPEMLALDTLDERFGAETQENTEAPGSNGSAYDLFAEHIGRIHSGGDGRWSQDTGAKFAEGMVEKRQQGDL